MCRKWMRSPWCLAFCDAVTFFRAVCGCGSQESGQELSKASCRKESRLDQLHHIFECCRHWAYGSEPHRHGPTIRDVSHSLMYLDSIRRLSTPKYVSPILQSLPQKSRLTYPVCPGVGPCGLLIDALNEARAKVS